ncbi:Coiled-coil and C2 domain-containing protein 2A [Kappamyces sp. JEL0680]|nr:Coiled-coil and C2 domain-containing protein 2A [Kappamyces sp. JEL0680]
MTLVPLHVEAPDVQLQSPHYLRDQAESQALQTWNSRNHINYDDQVASPIDLGFLKRIRDLQMIRKNALLKPRHVDDYVSEARLDPAPDQEVDLFSFFRPLRPLNPYRTNRQNVVSQDADKCKLVIQLQSGMNLPVRKGSKGAKLKPFVELSFQKRKTRSHTAEGPQPLWNQTLSVDIEAPDSDFRPEALMETDIATDVIYISLYDEMVVDMLQDDRERDKEMYIRKEKVYMGSIEIPFPSVWERSRIDGKFLVNIPPSLLGYTQDSGSDEIIRIDAHEQPLLHIFVTLDPPLRQPPLLSLKVVVLHSP